MYLPRAQISQLYTELLRTTHPLSPPVLILTGLSVDSLCATRILTSLLKRDYIPHKVQPVSGYADLRRVGQELVLPLTRQHGGDGGVVVCLGAGGTADLINIFGLEEENPETGSIEEITDHGVEIWVVEARRPWNLRNVFGFAADYFDSNIDNQAALAPRQGVLEGKILSTYRPGRGGVIVWDDGDIEDELKAERKAIYELNDIPVVTNEDVLREAEAIRDAAESVEPDSSQSRKRKARSPSREFDGDEDQSEDERPRQRRRSNSSTPIPSSPGGNVISGQQQVSSTPISSQPQSPAAVPSSPPISRPSRLKELKKKRDAHEATLRAYENLGTSYSESVSSMLYSLASELGREDNDLLWLAIVGISSVDLSPFSQPASSAKGSSGRRILDKQEMVREILRDEVRRLNPIPESELRRNQGMGDSIIPTHARSPTDTSIRLSPEPKFLLIRHWSLYDSMLHSPFLSTRLHVWSDAGRKRLNKLLAKMGVSLQEAGKGYLHMDMEIKRSLRERILKFAEMYNLDGLVPGDDGRTGKEGWGFVRSWGWKATLSAVDVAITVGAILEVGTDGASSTWDMKHDPHSRNQSYNSRVRSALPTPPHSEDGSSSQIDTTQTPSSSDLRDWTTNRFFAAYDALNPTTTSSTQGLTILLSHIKTAQSLHRAILRTGSALIAKKQIRHLKAFRMAVVKEGPDVQLFAHPGALTKLAGWLSEAVAVLEAEKGGDARRAATDQALVLACLDEGRGVYVVVGLGGGGAGRKKMRSKAEIQRREQERREKESARAVKKAERARKKEEKRARDRENREALGIFDSDDENEDRDSDDAEDSDSTEADSDDDDSDAEADDERARRGYGLNRFGQAFEDVAQATGARITIDSFESSVVEVRKDDLSGFLQALSSVAVVG